MDTRLRLPPDLHPEAAPAWIGAWRAAREEPGLELDLPGDAIVRPACVSLLAAGVAWRHAQGLHTRLNQVGGAGDAVKNLRRMGFFADLQVELGDDVVSEDLPQKVVPMRRISDRKIARDLANETADWLEEQLPDVAPSPLRMARFIFEELGHNIVQHSDAPATGFGLAQADPAQRRVEIAFADAGVGFLRSLQKNPDLDGRIESDGDALQIAMERGVTGAASGRSNMGVGLAMLQSFADLVGGDIWIASGDALLHRRTVGQVRSTALRSIPRWDGSWICLRARLG